MWKTEKYNQLAEQVMELAGIRLLSRLRFLSGAVTAVDLEAGEEAEDGQEPEAFSPFLYTDGKVVWYRSRIVLEIFAKEKEQIAAALMHTLFHCLMGHPFCCQEREMRLWNLACDMASERVRLELSKSLPGISGDECREAQLDRICDYAGGSAAEILYNYLIDADLPEQELQSLEHLFLRDDHGLWQRPDRNRSRQKKGGPPEKERDQEEEETQEQLPMALCPEEERSTEEEKTRKQWKKIARQVQMELATFSRQQGKQAGTLTASLKSFLFEEVDYSQFLRIFAAENEVLQISDEEFDVIYYTYGLKKYGNIPLIEPMEYSNLNKVREFVIAIDTSGSVQGELVQEFLRRTCHVLRQSSSFTRKVKIYVLQCDAKIQQCVSIENLDDFERFIKTMQLSGFGGTDFRPVFEYVEELLEQRKLKKLDGLLYFTDGIGTYPEKPPEYKTAFIFHRDDSVSPEVPSWAIRAVLTSNNIRIMKDKKI